jgi:hypothetical protein
MGERSMIELTPEELNNVIRRMFGPGKAGMEKMARALNVRPDTLRHVLKRRRNMPPGWAIEINEMVEGLSNQVQEPDGVQDRADQIADAICPNLHTLMLRAEAAGWLPHEIIDMVCEWSITQMLDRYGPQEAKKLLLGLMEEVEQL